MRKAAGSTCLRPCCFAVRGGLVRVTLCAVFALCWIPVIFANAPLIESEKERNLCTKFFAGYFFNEFTPGYSKRIALFNRYIQEAAGRDDLRVEAPHVSFDTHAYLMHLEVGVCTRALLVLPVGHDG